MAPIVFSLNKKTYWRQIKIQLLFLLLPYDHDDEEINIYLSILLSVICSFSLIYYFNKEKEIDLDTILAFNCIRCTHDQFKDYSFLFIVDFQFYFLF